VILTGEQLIMKTVRDILETKGYDVWWVAPDTTVYDALKLMSEKNVGALLVLDQGEIVGIISERDYARKVILKGRTSREAPVRDIMSERVVYVGPDDSVENCMAIFTDKHIRHLPVMDEGKLAGIVSIGDVVKTMIADRDFIINQLERYITGKH
jgi:predicted transcriptional regulator